MGAIYEVGPNTYQPTNFAKTLTIQKYADSFPCMWVTQYFEILVLKPSL